MKGIQVWLFTWIGSLLLSCSDCLVVFILSSDTLFSLHWELQPLRAAHIASPCFELLLGKQDPVQRLLWLSEPECALSGNSLTEPKRKLAEPDRNSVFCVQTWSKPDVPPRAITDMCSIKNQVDSPANVSEPPPPRTTRCQVRISTLYLGRQSYRFINLLTQVCDLHYNINTWEASYQISLVPWCSTAWQSSRKRRWQTGGRSPGALQLCGSRSL